MNLLARLDVICRLYQILLCVVLLAPTAVWSHEASMTAIGISIDDHDRFIIATSGVDILSRGYFDVREPFSVRVKLSESSVARSKPGRFWSSVVGGQDTLKLVKGVFSALKMASGNPPFPFRVCTITSPLALSTSQKELVSSALVDIFGCTDENSVIRETEAITSALNIEPVDVENSPIAVVVPNEFTYILEEYYSTVVVIDTFPPPLNLDLVVTKHNVWEIIIVQSSDKPQLDPVYGTRKIPIRYEPDDIIARGAAIIAALALPKEPVSVLPLSLGVVLHGSLLHVAIPSFSVLPKQVKLTLTTVHHNQQTAMIEIREGTRARAPDNLFVTKLRLDDIPPAPAGAVLIELTLTVERNNNRIIVDALETLSGRKIGTKVEHDALAYSEEVLETQQAAAEKFYDEDAQFRASMGERISRETQPEDAVQLFIHPSTKREEL
ncbi:DnaK family protein [Rhizoctonia solani 123E]|uniref:DnaK family protein n=1 Tax=Rhizoctonia solani 123E TaxID=1423351 RepID=A0A074S5H2_9AGAM|nr:DnaK family protein [Rhizoctonia solani 123E]